MEFREHLNQMLRESCLQRKTELGWNYAELTRRALNLSHPTTSDKTAVREAMAGQGSLLGQKGLKVLVALGCQEVRPCWENAVKEEPAPKLKGRMAPDIHPLIQKLNLAALSRLAALGSTQASAAKKIDLAPNALNDILMGRILILRGNGVRFLDSIGLVKLEPVWGPPVPAPAPPRKTTKITAELTFESQLAEQLSQLAERSGQSLNALVTTYVKDALAAAPTTGSYSQPVVARLTSRELEQVAHEAQRRGLTLESFARNALLVNSEPRQWTAAQLRAIQAEATTSGHLWTLEELRERRLPLYWNEQWVREQMQQGRSPAEIAELAGGWGARNASHYVLNVFGIRLRQPQLDEQTAAYIREQVAAGRSRLEVADELGVSRSRASHHAEGLPTERTRRFERQAAKLVWPATTQEIAAALFDGRGNRASSWCRDMVKSGRLIRIKHGLYGKTSGNAG